MILSGNVSDYIKAFAGGILASFTPCVYPIMPIVAGYIGITAGRSRIRGLFLSLVYVTGLAITYSILGFAAALTGTLFGTISAKPVTRFITAGIVILFGASMLFERINLSIPVFNPPEFRKKDYISAFFLGAISGFIVGPCLTPVLGSILLFLAAKKNAFYGATLLLSFAYGMGIILIIIGSFSATLIKLPRPGKWMLYVKKACGLILIGAGVYFILTAIRRIG